MSLHAYIQQLEKAKQEAREQAEKREQDQAAAKALASAKANQIRDHLSAHIQKIGFVSPVISSFEETRYLHEGLNKVLSLHFSTQEKFSLGVRFDGSKLGDITITQDANGELLYKSSKYPNAAPSKDLISVFDLFFAK